MRIPRNRLSALLVGLSLALILAIAIATVQWQRAEVAQVTLQAHSATELFKSEPQEALLLAMRSAYRLKVLTQNEQPGKYPTVEPILVLQNILNNIQARVYDTKTSIQFTDEGDRLLSIGNLIDIGWLFLGIPLRSRSFAIVYDLQGNQISQIIKGRNNEFFETVTSQLSPDGKSILLGERIGTKGTEINAASLWDLQGKRIATFQAIQGEGLILQSNSPQYKFSPDNQYIIAGLPGRPIHVWNRQGKLLAVLKNQRRQDILDMQFSPNSKSILTGGMDGISLWNLQGKKISNFKNPQIPTNAVQFSADGQQIFSYHVDGTINRWNLQGERLATFKVPQLDLRIDNYNNMFSPDQLLNLAAFDNIDRVALSPDGRYIAAQGYRYRKELRDYISGIQVWNLAGNELAWFELGSCSTQSWQFSSDSQRLASQNCFWDWQNSQPTTFKSKGKQPTIATVKFSPDGKYILTIENLRAKNEETGDFTPTNDTNNRDRNYSISLWNLRGERLATIDRLGKYFDPDSVFLAPKAIAF
jgi:WD40 repeat protein